MPAFHVGPHEMRFSAHREGDTFPFTVADPVHGAITKRLTFAEASELWVWLGGELVANIQEGSARIAKMAEEVEGLEKQVRRERGQ